MPKSILLLDDSATIRSVLRVYLTGRTFEFLEAERAEQGLELLKASPIDLIVADIHLPGMSGLDFVREVRSGAVPAARETPIILLTIEKSEALREAGLKAGANAFVHKPIFSSSLLEAVNRLLPPEP
jgi:DNA-binding response OmpR family regulator